MNAFVRHPTPDLLQLKTGDLLTAFGAGQPTPGPGSAAALNGALACELVMTATKLTASRVRDVERLRMAEMVSSQLEPKCLLLRRLAQRDTDLFAQVVSARREKERAVDRSMKRRHADRARRRLADANDVLVQIARECAEVAKLALVIVKHVWGGAKGEPIAGISNAIAGSLTAISVTFFNLRKLRGKRARQVHTTVESALHEVFRVQAAFMQVVTGMQRQVHKTLPQQLEWAF